MEKIMILLWLSAMCIAVEGNAYAEPKNLYTACLKCHQSEQVPSSLVYRRYLMRYSTPERIKKAMFSYLKAPEKADSIMPPQFFLKFPMKKKMQMNDMLRKKYIREYIEQFDVKKRLVLP